MFREQFDGGAGADRAARCVGEKPAKNWFARLTAAVRDGHRADPDLGVGAYLLGDRERVLQQAAECGGRRVCGLLRDAKRLLELSQYLRFAEDHRVEPAGDAKKVPDRRVVVERKQRFTERRIEPLRSSCSHSRSRQAAGCVGHDIKLGAIAGRQQDGLVDAGSSADRPVSARATSSPVEHDLFANFDRCRVMVQPEYLQRHNGLVAAPIWHRRITEVV